MIGTASSTLGYSVKGRLYMRGSGHSLLCSRMEETSEPALRCVLTFGTSVGRHVDSEETLFSLFGQGESICSVRER